jgi:D-arabinose 1-dehydrogenase-like Zn-dependent alcohol dehydrogenase
MKYIVCEKPGEFLLKEKKEHGKAILKVKKVGVCGTDLHAYSGDQAFFDYPRILVHKLATEVVDIEDNNKGIKVGDNVVVMPYISCNKCIACKNGKTNCCSKMQVLGVHADGGRNILVGLSKREIAFNHPAIHAKETTLMCSRNATLEDFKHNDYFGGREIPY